MNLSHLRTLAPACGALFFTLTPASAVDRIAPQPVTDIHPTGDANPANITYAEDKLYFTATDARGRSGLYVKTLVIGRNKVANPALSKPPLKIKALHLPDGTNREVDNFVVSRNEITQKDTLYFHVKGDGLYLTRGSAMTTPRLLKWNDVSGGFYINPQVTAFQGSGASRRAGVVFTGFKPTTGFEPFFTTGGAAKPFADINPGANSSFPYDYCARPSGIYQDQIFFGAFDPEDQYQLHYYKMNTDERTFTLAHYNTARTATPNDNFATFPRGMTLAGNDIAFSGGNHPADNLRDLGLVDTQNELSSYLTTSSIDPQNFGEGFGSTVYFAGSNVARTKYVLWQGIGGVLSGAQIYDETVVGSSPRNIKTYGARTYVVADEATGTHLYRIFSKDFSTRIKTNTNADLIVTGEYTGVVDPDGNGHIFLVGHVAGGQNQLWIVDNSQGGGTEDETAAPILTPGGFPLLDPTGLANATHLVGATAYSRLYFSCSGTGTEFEFKKDRFGNPTSTPRGRELWVFQPADNEGQ